MSYTERHPCGCVWEEDHEDPDAVRPDGTGLTRTQSCEEHQ